MIKYLYAKLLYLFGLASNNPKLAEAVWSQVQATVQYSAVQFSTVQYSTVQAVWSQVSGSGLTEQDVKPGLASPGWPVLVYLATVVTAPYIIWKLVRRT